MRAQGIRFTTFLSVLTAFLFSFSFLSPRVEAQDNQGAGEKAVIQKDNLSDPPKSDPPLTSSQQDDPKLGQEICSDAEAVSVRLFTADGLNSYFGLQCPDGSCWTLARAMVECRTSRPSAGPAPTNPSASVVEIEKGSNYNLARKSNGSVWAWEDNPQCFPVEETWEGSIPVQIPGLNGIAAISAGAYHGLALKNDGSVWGWSGARARERSPAVQVVGLSGITAISAGHGYNLALRNDGSVWAWGSNDYGQLGDGTTNASSTPVRVLGLNGITAVSAGSTHSLALQNDGRVWAWGSNNHGQLGFFRTLTQSMSPILVPLSGISAISAGWDHSLALNNESVLAWGSNQYGQLGDGTTNNRLVPVATLASSGIAAISAGVSGSLALQNDGQLSAWGGAEVGALCLSAT